ncbi:MAG TPA: hypothetical protein P5270_02800, partial [Victivallales bacterium]|nr:hypothetical protein [Victivallales bacterium]
TKESFNKTLGPIISESPHRRLQFYQRDQVALFRIIRYRGRDDKLNHDYVQCYKKESDKIQPDELPIFLKQYCIWEAKGTYEFNFYIDLGDLDKWDYKWDKEKYSLTLFPPDIGVNTPAEIENLQFTKIKDSVSIDETYTRRRLEEAITSGINGEKPLKIQLAEEQKKLFYNQAREAIKDLYIKFLSKIPNIKIEKYPEIIVVFPHEREKLHLSKKKL